MNAGHWDTIQDALVFTLFSLGLLAMVTVIHFQSDIDGFWSSAPVQAAAISTAPIQIQPAVLTPDQQNAIQQILNTPQNLASPAAVPTPAQAILDDRGTKFLMGM